MPRVQFIADLQRPLPPGATGAHIKHVRPGNDDGTFTFVFDPLKPGTKSIEITGIIPDVSEYPTSHQVIIFSTSSHAPTYATKTLESLQLNTLSVRKILDKVTDALNRSFLFKMDKVVEVVDLDFSEEVSDVEDDEALSQGGWSDDDGMIIDIGESSADDDLSGDAKKQHLKELRDDLRKAKKAGFKVGLLGDHGEGDFYLSLSIRIAKLGLSDEATSAWRLDRKKYFIVLIHYRHYYRRLESLINEQGVHQRGVDIMVGMASRYKPTASQATDAFTRTNAFNEEQFENHVAAQAVPSNINGTESISDNGEFEEIFLSGPLNELLNSRLLQLLKYRLKFGFGWDGAELFYSDHQGKDTGSTDTMHEKYYLFSNPKTALAPIVAADALTTSSSNPYASFPLLTIQYALRHLVRCTEFCLVCHNKVTTDFEALKPYVCSNPLCLYQYMCHGFGPSIEYEIVSQPSVVDLLISFCYAAAMCSKLKEFPIGMDLRVTHRTCTAYKAYYNRLSRELVFGSDDDRPPIEVGSWIAMTLLGNPMQEWHGRIIETIYYPTVKLGPLIETRFVQDDVQKEEITIRLPINRNGKKPAAVSSTVSEGVLIPGEADIVQVSFQIYNHAFDTLKTSDKVRAILKVLDMMPRVSEMQAWLKMNPKVAMEKGLKGWSSRMSPASIGILRWIIASNRSCIIPLTNAEEQKVLGVPGCMQFKFAMGAPDKEQRFVNSVRGIQRKRNPDFPTLYAFHGSRLESWHGIIREGLNFNEMVNGRVYGHGCYHSLNLSTSLGYSMNQGCNPNDPGWPHSDLRITAALSLNEIVNSPMEFVSNKPHIVVAQLDWIQTRYLFVYVGKVDLGLVLDDVGAASRQTPEVPQEMARCAQDPEYTPYNGATPLIIPARPKAASGALPGNKKRKRCRGIFVCDSDTESIATSASDCNALLSDDESPSLLLPPRPPHPTDYIPDTLELSTLPILPPPSYATHRASKRLSTDLTSIIKLQISTTPHELGFHVLPEVENLYQWIVELHSFPHDLPLTQDMAASSPPLRSIVAEIRFGPNYPLEPPFVRIIRPRFRPFVHGGGGNVTAGGAMCMELLTTSGWSVAFTVESVLMQVRLALCDEERPARLLDGLGSYDKGEAVEAYLRACRAHGWGVPRGLTGWLR